jgi:PTS system N-acetylglucosamine-specific IIC component
MVDRDLVKDEELKALGAKGVVRPGVDSLQVVVGPIAESIARDMKALQGGAPAAPASPVDRWLDGLGGAANVKGIAGFHSGRVRVVLADEAALDEAALLAAGVHGVMRLADGVVHLLVGPEAPRYAAALEEQRKG